MLVSASAATAMHWPDVPPAFELWIKCKMQQGVRAKRRFKCMHGLA